MKTLLTILAAAIMALIGLIVGLLIGPWFGVAAFLALAGLFVYTGLVEIKANPPHVGAVTFFGKRTGEVLNEGIRFLPFNKILYDLILVNITKMNLDFPVVRFRTPDRAELETKVSITMVPSRRHLISYLDSGGKEGISNILQDIISGRIIAWGMSQTEGPKNWVEAQASSEEAIALIIKSVLGEELGRIPSSIPTATLIKFFSATKSELEGAALDEYERTERKLQNEGNFDEVKDAIKARMEAVTKIRQGKGKYPVPSLGVSILRVNVSDIHVIGGTAQAAEQEAKENQEKAAEEAEIKHVENLAKKLKEALGISAESAMEIVMLERGKITKAVDDKKINISMSPELITAAKALINLFDKKGGE